MVLELAMKMDESNKKVPRNKGLALKEADPVRGIMLRSSARTTMTLTGQKKPSQQNQS